MTIVARCRAMPPTEDWRCINLLSGVAEVNADLEAAGDPRRVAVKIIQDNTSLGDIMQESIQAAMTVVRSRVDALGIDPKFYQKTDVHIHVPEGATPKDGPSAGVGMCTALVSALTRIPVHSNVARAGRITLRGEVLPIGGLKERLLAALRGGIDIVLIPDENRPELTEIPANILQNLDVRPVKWIDEVFEVALQHMPRPVSEGEETPEAVEGETPADDGGRKPVRTH